MKSIKQIGTHCILNHKRSLFFAQWVQMTRETVGPASASTTAAMVRSKNCNELLNFFNYVSKGSNLFIRKEKYVLFLAKIKSFFKIYNK